MRPTREREGKKNQARKKVKNEKAIDATIRAALNEIKYHLCKLPIKNDAVMKEYTFPSVSITCIRTTPDGVQVADIEAEIAKEDAKYRRIDESGKPLGFAKYDSFDHYFDDGVEWQMFREDITCGEKALLLTQLAENISRNFMEDAPITARTAMRAAIDLRDKMLLAKASRNEQSKYQVQLDKIKTIDNHLAETSEIKIMDFIEEIFFNPMNYEKLRRHENEGRFDAGEPCKIKQMRPIEYRD